jgi:hypothetical protein
MTSIKVSDNDIVEFINTEEYEYEVGYGCNDCVIFPIDLTIGGKFIAEFMVSKNLEYDNGVFKSSHVKPPEVYHYPCTPNIKINEELLLIFDSIEQAYRVAKELNKCLASLLKKITVINCDEYELVKAIRKNGEVEKIADSTIYSSQYCGHTFYSHLHSKYPFDCRKECILSLSKKIKTKFKEALEKDNDC